MIIDPHIHSSYSSDSRMTPKEIIEQARKIGLDAIAIADHNSIKGAQVGIKEAKGISDLIVIPAMEVSTNKGHIVALGINKEIKSYMSPEETVEAIRDANGIAIAPHPFVRYREGLCDKVKDLDIDAMETLNSRYVFGYSNWRAKKLAEERGIPQIGASDAHFLGAIGSCVTELDADFSIDSIIECILSGKTNVFGDRTPLPLILKEVIDKKIKKI
ncbi:MAG: PHP domain-containing protein [Methanobacterium sp.]|uniref:PHP domain-containing protein n=1 Tax=Methanobacterium sp. TaxID=2164 RepID=UPI003D6539D6|nr:PHP domain-containing protein [Methanobacterium sp.]